MKLPGTYYNISVRLEKIPVIKLPSAAPLSAAEATQIKSLIRQLAKTNQRDFGLKPEVAGVGFAPIRDPEFAHIKVNPNQLPAFAKLVRIGPRALPFLLEALNDATPTGVTFKLGGIVSVMIFTNEVEGNPANAREKKILSGMPDREEEHRREVTQNYRTHKPPPHFHTITVGDLCFNIIGQIVGRSYEAIRYQPSGNYIVSSPTRDPSIVQAVRAIWSSSNPEQHVLNSLLLDFATRGIAKDKSDESMSDWGIGNNFQRIAAKHLLFYFSPLTRSMIAQRLNHLRVEAVRYDSPADIARWKKREFANGVEADLFIHAVNWCTEPEIRAALIAIFQRAGDREVLLASLPALNPSRHWPLVELQFRTVFGSLDYSEDKNQWFRFGDEALAALRRLGGDRARSLFHYCIKLGGDQCCFSICDVLDKTKGEWDKEFLWPMLSNKGTMMYRSHYSKPNNYEHISTRVCDAAAEVISKHRKDVTFNIVGTTKELDRQISRMRSQLGVTPPKR